MGQFRKVTKSITSTMTRLITTLATLRLCPSLSTAAATNPSRGISAFAEYAIRSLVVTKPLARDAAQSVSEQIVREKSESAAPAYDLTVDKDECYFVRGDDGLAYLVSNSSHSADALGLLAVAYETPPGRPQKLKYKQMGIV